MAGKCYITESVFFFFFFICIFPCLFFLVISYTSIDQIFAPIYMGLFLLLVDFVPLCKRALVNPNQQEESIGQAIRTTWQKIMYDRFGEKWGREEREGGGRRGREEREEGGREGEGGGGIQLLGEDCNGRDSGLI